MSKNQTRTKEQIDGIVGDASSMLSVTGRLVRIVWNVQMQMLVAINAMGIFQNHWWRFLVVGGLLTGLFLPIGVVWIVIAYFALQNEPKAKGNHPPFNGALA